MTDALSDARADALALGGRGGDGADGGSGGDAFLLAEVTTSGDGNDIAIGDQTPNFPPQSGAVGGDGGGVLPFQFQPLSRSGDGGDATSRSIGTANGDSAVTVLDVARGGDSSRESQQGGHGGSARSRAEGTNQGSAPVIVRADAEAGRGEGFGLGGTAVATAFGSSPSGDVLVEARQSQGSNGAVPGLDSVMLDAAQGSTEGQLTLRQTSWAGHGGTDFNLGFRGGDAISHLSAEKPSGGDLVLESSARGGGGFGTFGSIDGGAGGSATAAAFGTGGPDVDVRVTGEARGGSGGFTDSSLMSSGDGGDAFLGGVRADTSGSGEATVIGRAIGGAGGHWGSENVGNGADVALRNAVDGSSSRSLRLVQSAQGGTGGDGGDAASEMFIAKATERLQLEIEAIGGSTFFSFGFPAAAGSGGDAAVLAEARNESGDLVALGRAAGGHGGPGGDTLLGDGGSAVIDVLATTAPGTQTLRIGSASPADTPLFGALGGSGGDDGSPQNLDGVAARGGAASSLSRGIAEGSGPVTVFDRAVGGRGGSWLQGTGDGGVGGAATSRAEASNSGDSDVVVHSEATGGSGGSVRVLAGGVAGSGGAGDASATGSSTGGGNVQVTAVQTGGHGGGASNAANPGGTDGDPADGIASMMSNAVSGSTAGILTLTQRAVGGDGGSAAQRSTRLGRGGEARSSLDATNPGGGDLVAIAEAVGGGAGVSRNSRAMDGAPAQASAIGTSDSNVAVRASATGGFGGSGDSTPGTGGAASLGPVLGISTGGGRVEVVGEATGGRGGDGGSFEAGFGSSITLENAVDGETSGVLRLVQRAVGGDRGTEGGISPSGRGGDATSVLSRTKSAQQLLVRSEARGGDSSGGFTGSGPEGGASADATARNDSGEAAAEALAVGGDGTFENSSVEVGTATARARAETTGDGHAVVVGSSPVTAATALWNIPDTLVLTTGAQGGTGRNSSRGASAASESIGVAFGNSPVVVFDVARGGRGGPNAGIGGSATSHAEGTASGGGPVDVRALALGGIGGPAQQNPNFPRILGDGGAANSSAVARGLGDVFASASALSGHSGRFAPDAVATATAEGVTGSAVAEAAARVDTLGAVYARASSSLDGAATVEARAATHDVAADVAVPRDAFAAVAGLPRSPLVEEALLGNDLLSSLVDQPSDALALAHWRTESTRDAENGSSILLRSEFHLDLLGFFFGASGVYLGLLNPEAGSTGFDSLRFVVEKGGESLVDRVFSDSDEALEFFDDQALDLGNLTYPGSTIHLLMELTASDPGASFASDLLVVRGTVPEPSTLLLVALGIACLALRRRARDG